MIVAAAQFCPTFKNVDANIASIITAISTTQADVIVFPELSTSGYFFLSTEEALPFSDEVGGERIARIIDSAKHARKVVVCGFCERDGNTLYNSALVCGHDIATTVYRKTHLFYREADVFTPGNTGFFVVDIPHLDCKLGTMICYDWRFPEAARTLALKGADLIACPSNLITHIWRMAMPVRALENKVYLAVANRAGIETNNNETVSFNGESVIYGYNGSVLASAHASTDAIIAAEIVPSETRNKQFNAVNDLFKDRRPDYYD
jgi:5-aminopentanamidase